MGTRPYQSKRAPGSLLLDLDRGDPTPLFDQIYTQIRTRILAGQLVRGAALPSSRRLATELGVSRTTVLQALDALESEGYVVASTRSAIRGAAAASKPRLSRRARIRLPKGAPRLGAAPRAFRPGVPALELFPIAEWTRFVARSHLHAHVALLEATDSAGHRGLREAIAGHVATARGVQCTAAQVFITTGMTQTFGEVLQLCVDPGDSVWVEDPGYLSARRAVLAAAARPSAVPGDRE